MDFSLPLEVREQAERARRFAEERLSSPARAPGFNQAIWRAAVQSGVFDLALPQAWGGQGRGALATAVVFEAMGRGGADRSLLFAMGAHLFGCTLPIATYATPTQSGRWGDGLRTGTTIGALAVTESAGGSSLDMMATEYSAIAGGYVLNGEKTLVTNAPDAGLFVVLARQMATHNPLAITAFLVPRDAAGLSVTPIASTVGLHGAPMGMLTLDRCTAPTEAVLGRPNAGLKVFATAMQWERTCLLAGFLGAAERDLATCVGALSARHDRNGTLLRHQALSHRLARMQLRLESARLLAHRAAWSIDQGRDDQTIAAFAKLAVSEAVVECAQDGLRLLAGPGWRGEPTDFSGALADALGGLLASGTSEIQLNIIARHLQSEHRRK